MGGYEPRMLGDLHASRNRVNANLRVTPASVCLDKSAHPDEVKHASNAPASLELTALTTEMIAQGERRM
jgi:hypothetical protein